MLEGNPWRRLPEEPPFVLREDDEVLQRYPELRANLRLDSLPVPFLGSDRADILLLTLNPGARTNDLEVGETFVKERRRGLRFESSFPFWCLNPDFSETAGYRYWDSRLRLLIGRVGREVVAQSLLVVQYFPYQSLTMRRSPEPLPSQRFSFSLVEKAIDAGKLIVVMRSRRYWLEAVPKLAAYGFIELRNPRSPYVTPNNMGQEEFDRLLARLESNALGRKKAQRTLSSARVAAMRTRRLDAFQKLALATTATTCLLILVGGLVRAAGAGLGCPDWPKCFGSWVPPTRADQLPPAFDPARFNAALAWTEYLNRLLGVMVGFLIFATLAAAIAGHRRARRVLWPTLLALLLVGFQGWLGGRVVAHGLEPWIVPAHLVVALVIVSLLLYATVNAFFPAAAAAPSPGRRRIGRAVGALLALTLAQVAMGTQVRSRIDEVARAAAELLRRDGFFSEATASGYVEQARQADTDPQPATR